MIGLSIDAIQVGDHAEITRRASETDIADFVEAIGDYNPIHSDPDYAAGTVFGGPIAPGMWTAGLVSAVIGTRLPGPGAIYLSQSLKFMKPVMLGDEITARVEVVETNREKNRMQLRTVCVNQRGEEVLTGEAVVKPSLTRVTYAREPPVADLLAVWTFAPWAWLTQGAALWGMLGVSALALGRAAVGDREAVRAS